MEIINLKGEVRKRDDETHEWNTVESAEDFSDNRGGNKNPGGRRGYLHKGKHNAGEQYGDVIKITDIKQAVRNENRVNIYVNNEYSFSLDIQQVVDFRIKIGKVITKAELSEYKKASEFGKLYQRALEWVLMRPRSEREVRDYLKRKMRDNQCTDGDLLEKIVERLVERGYVDDEKFAKYYVENRFVKKGVSKRRLEMELMKKGIARDTIESIMNESGRDDTEEIRKMIARKRDKYDDDKLIQYLCRQGFPYDLVRELVLNYGKD